MLHKVNFAKSESSNELRSQSQVSQLTSSKDLSRSESLSEVLQTTLDTNQLLSVFAEFVSERMTLEALQFVSDDQICNLLGDFSDNHHQHSVMLYADKEYLGQLVYNLKRPLTMPQKLRLEKWHRELTFPLRNALKFTALHRMAVRDHLTGLGNRALLEEVMQHLHVKQQREKTHSHAIMILDLDGFKTVNDVYGHYQGDEILKHFACLLRDIVRDSDQVFRFGGDEFIIVMEDTSPHQAEEVYGRIREATLADSLISQFAISTSAGTAQLECFNDVQQTLEEADQFLYQAKRKGKNRHCSVSDQTGVRLKQLR